MLIMNPTRFQAEAQARELLSQALPEEVQLLADCQALLRQLSDSLGTDEATPLHRQAHRRLAGRLADDLRVFEWALTSGYPFQAMSIAAGIYELALTAAFIGCDDDLAAKWLNWDEPSETPWRRPEILKSVLKQLFSATGRLDQYGAIYRILCTAKHGNPLSLARYQPAATSFAHLLNVDPDVSPGRARQALFILWMTLTPVTAALALLQDRALLTASQSAYLDSLADPWLRLDQRMGGERPSN